MESHSRRHLTLCEGMTHQRQTGESRGWALEHSDIWILRRFGTIYVFWEKQPVRRRQECSIFVILTESDDLMDKSFFKARLDLISRSLTEVYLRTLLFWRRSHLHVPGFRTWTYLWGATTEPLKVRPGIWSWQLFTACVTLGKLHNLSGLLFPVLWSGGFPVRIKWESICAKC